jgi:hypothetical protein
MSRREEFEFLIESVLTNYSENNQINLSSSSARKDIARAIVSKLLGEKNNEKNEYLQLNLDFGTNKNKFKRLETINREYTRILEKKNKLSPRFTEFLKSKKEVQND